MRIEELLAKHDGVADTPRNRVLLECWDRINSQIKPGQLLGNGSDETAQRNGLILAANMILEMTECIEIGHTNGTVGGCYCEHPESHT